MQPNVFIKILIVDDDEKVLNALERQLIFVGYRVVTASSVAIGMEILKSEAIQLVITDMKMPMQNGNVLLEHIDVTYPSIKTVLLTGYSDTDLIIDAINQGKVDQVIKKPWQENEIEEAVQKLLTIQQQAEEKKMAEEALLARKNELSGSLENSNQQLKKVRLSLKAADLAIVDLVSNLVHMILPDLRIDLEDISLFACALGEQFDLSKASIANLKTAVQLYPLGKIFLTDDLRSRKPAMYNQKEMAEYKQFPIYTNELLISYIPLKPIADILIHVNENVDGSGFPNEIGTDSIKLEAKILRVVIDFFELQHGLVVADKLTNAMSLDYLEQHQNIYYDPNVIKQFKPIYAQWLKNHDMIAEEKIECRELKIGMVLSRSLYSPKGMKLLSKGQCLDDKLILKVNRLGPQFAFVEVQNQ